MKLHLPSVMRHNIHKFSEVMKLGTNKIIFISHLSWAHARLPSSRFAKPSIEALTPFLHGIHPKESVVALTFLVVRLIGGPAK